jgi:Tol biopolymer transport system component
MRNHPALVLLGLTSGALLSSCNALGIGAPPIPGAKRVDHLIEPGEVHFEALWQLTAGGENAEAYWSFDGERLSLQLRNPDEGIDCDRIFVTEADAPGLTPVSDGTGTTTCAYFYPDGEHVIYASTRGGMADCPPPLDYSQGYVWKVYPEHDLWVRDLVTGELTQITDHHGYDAEATVSPIGDRVVFTSTRSGDLELWTCDLDGGNLVQVTDTLGYDGGGFFSHDGQRIVFRTTAFDPANLEQEHATYRELLTGWTVRPHRMDLYVIDADGGGRRQLTDLNGASFAPFFFPDDRRVIFASNHHDDGGRNFDLFAVDADVERATSVRRVTYYEGFDSFPIFSPDGKWMAFSSNRGGSKPGETNVFVVKWREPLLEEMDEDAGGYGGGSAMLDLDDEPAGAGARATSRDAR